MNKVFLVGRLTRDPELRYTASNLATMRTAIAVDRHVELILLILWLLVKEQKQ